MKRVSKEARNHPLRHPLHYKICVVHVVESREMEWTLLRVRRKHRYPMAPDQPNLPSRWLVCSYEIRCTTLRYDLPCALGKSERSVEQIHNTKYNVFVCKI